MTRQPPSLDHAKVARVVRPIFHKGTRRCYAAHAWRVVYPSSSTRERRRGNCHSQAEFGAECAVRLRALGVQFLEYLPEHRPFGDVNRMRRAVCFVSRQLRRKLNMVSDEQPKPDRSGGLQRTVPPSVENEALHAERRQLTVVFVDIVGSTPLSERIDPEEFFAVIKTYRDICDKQIRHYGGHIARMLGDGLLAFFGVPQAHENDPERAVRASLAIAAAIKEHKFLLSDGS